MVIKANWNPELSSLREIPGYTQSCSLGKVHGAKRSKRAPKNANKPTKKQTNKETNKEKNKQADRQIDKETNIETEITIIESEFLTSVPLYVKPSRGLTSSGCWMSSELLNWHKTLSFIGGPMLIDTQLLSIVHRPLQESRIPVFKDIFLITWPCRAYPSTGVVNLRCRQRSVDKQNKTKIKNKIRFSYKTLQKNGKTENNLC